MVVEVQVYLPNEEGYLFPLQMKLEELPAKGDYAWLRGRYYEVESRAFRYQEKEECSRLKEVLLYVKEC